MNTFIGICYKKSGIRKYGSTPPVLGSDLKYILNLGRHEDYYLLRKLGILKKTHWDTSDVDFGAETSHPALIVVPYE